MTLIELLKINLLNARKSLEPEEVKTDLLTVLVSDCVRVGKDAGNREPTNDECIKVIRSFMKSCDTNIELYNKTGNIVQSNKASQEKSILSSYLPVMMSENQILNAMKLYSTASGGGDFKGVMAYFKLNYTGQYDGKLLSKLAKEIYG